MPLYHGDDSYESLKTYMKKAEDILSDRGNKVTLNEDKLMADIIHKTSKEAVLQLKKDHYNLKLEDFMMGADQGRLLDIIDGYVVPRTVPVFLTPRSHIGRAPFYSSEKIVGEWHIKTLWFNMSVLLLMSLIVMILLYNDCPGRFIRKDQ